MFRTIDILMTEHHLIMRVLHALAAQADRVAEGQPVERERLASFARFFSGFADRFHHGKEEDLLFKAMIAQGMSPDRGPIGVMLAEHDEGRHHVRAIAQIGERSGPLAAPEKEAFVMHARAFVPLLGNHIAKEDNVLYPMATRLLGPSILESMLADFEAFEQEVGPQERERLHALAESLLDEPAQPVSPPPSPRSFDAR